MARPTSSRSLLLCGLIMLILLAQAGLSAFALWRSQAENAQAREATAGLAALLDTARTAEIAFKVQVQEWKNILLRGHDPALRARHEAAFQLQLRNVNQAITRLGPRAAGLREAHAAVNALYATTLAQAQLATGDGARAADAEVRGLDRTLQNQIDDLAEGLLREQQASLRTAAEAAEASYASLSRLLNAGAAAGLVVTFLLLLLMVRQQP